MHRSFLALQASGKRRFTITRNIGALTNSNNNNNNNSDNTKNSSNDINIIKLWYYTIRDDLGPYSKAGENTFKRKKA